MWMYAYACTQNKKQRSTQGSQKNPIVLAHCSARLKIKAGRRECVFLKIVEIQDHNIDQIQQVSLTNVQKCDLARQGCRSDFSVCAVIRAFVRLDSQLAKR